MTSDEVDKSGQALWAPDSSSIDETKMSEFASSVGLECNYEILHDWSVEDPGSFWTAVWDFCDLVGDRGERSFVEAPSDSDLPLIDAKFFPDAQLNVAENLIWGGGAKANDVAIVSCDEAGRRSELTRLELSEAVNAMARFLLECGVEPGDRVAAWIPNIAEAVIAMLGSASIGAVFSSTSPDFGVDGVLDRFGQIEPKVLFAADGYFYGGKTLDCLERLREIDDRLPTVATVVVAENLGGKTEAIEAAGWHRFGDILRAPAPAEPTPMKRFEFDHPWYILYSSGTTGVPKCIVHRTGGLLLQHAKEHALHCNIARGDKVFYYTTCGWMMWNWLVSVLGTGATIYCYDGSPFHPGPEGLLSLAESEGLTFFGTSAKYLDSVRKDGYVPKNRHDLGSVRTVASTGSPLVAESFEWFYDNFAPHAHLASISGGTDLCSCFLLGDPTSPVFAGEIQRAGLGMDVGVISSDGIEVATDERGELVCRSPFPSSPLEFFNDPGRERLRSAYFEEDQEVWNHGDFVSVTEHGGYVVHGRSDTTLNPGGVRIGTAEIYRRVEQMDSIVEALVFGRELDEDTQIVLLVRVAEGLALSEELQAEIRSTIRTGCTPRHVPGLIVPVNDLPRTRSGKLAELAVSDIVNGREVRNTSALANPEALSEIARAVESAL